ncbi:helix-turn-helix transcriptional regulator [uncultured Thomasclavelia sp.]|uniref:helix-turn-helix domain-containing protein n=1 Tax=uncultured Thomasclavelia sp. TaxID=3025759 RepID=UPI0026062147|nr:helix-turn-helix transcriptional regulator [uncultured Thomasclavelia sp.]
MAKKITEVLGKTIRKERKERNLTQQDLADKTGISRRHIANIESGKINASFEVVLAIVKELNISLDNVIYADLNDNYKIELQKMAVQLSMCQDNQKQIALKTIDFMLSEFIAANH